MVFLNAPQTADVIYAFWQWI